VTLDADFVAASFEFGLALWSAEDTLLDGDAGNNA
jgi:hypothetical protein